MTLPALPRDDITGLVLAGGRGLRLGGLDEGVQPACHDPARNRCSACCTRGCGRRWKLFYAPAGAAPGTGRRRNAPYGWRSTTTGLFSTPIRRPTWHGYRCITEARFDIRMLRAADLGRYK